MLCAVYKSPKKLGSYLYVAKREDFSALPETLLSAFGKPAFVMMVNLAGNKSLANADKQEVMSKLQQQGFYLQMPKEDDWLFAPLNKGK